MASVAAAVAVAEAPVVEPEAAAAVTEPAEATVAAAVRST